MTLLSALPRISLVSTLLRARRQTPAGLLLRGAIVGHPPHQKGYVFKRTKFLLRAAAEPESTCIWLERLARPDTLPLWLKRPRLASKLQRPYLRHNWCNAQRLKALVAHYDRFGELFSARSSAAIYSDGLTLLPVAGPVGALDLRLVYRDQYEKEGDLTLTVEDAATTLCLASLTFTFGVEGGARVARIGGLQSGADSRVRELINAWTKQLHGLRPKALALWSLRELSASWQVERILAVSDAGHVGRDGRGRRSFTGHYDDFWGESEGVRRSEGEWELPLSVAPRPRAEIKPSRRKAHELRYAMLERLRGDLVAAQHGLDQQTTPALWLSQG